MGVGAIQAEKSHLISASIPQANLAPLHADQTNVCSVEAEGTVIIIIADTASVVMTVWFVNTNQTRILSFTNRGLALLWEPNVNLMDLNAALDPNWGTFLCSCKAMPELQHSLRSHTPRRAVGRSWAITTRQTPGDCVCWQGGGPAPPLNARMLRPSCT